MKRIFKSLFCLFIFFAVTQCFAATVCDFNEDQLINDKDIVTLFAFIQVDSLAKDGFAVLDLASVQDYARDVLGDQSFTLSRMPDVAKDDLSGNNTNILDDEDVVLLFAYMQVDSLAKDGFATLDFPSVESSATDLIGRTVSLSKFPTTPIGDSTIPVTITGIQTDQ